MSEKLQREDTQDRLLREPRQTSSTATDVAAASSAPAPTCDLRDAASIVLFHAGAVGTGAWIGELVGGLAGQAAGRVAFALVWPALVLVSVPWMARRWWGASPGNLGIRMPESNQRAAAFALSVGAAYAVLGLAYVAAVRAGYAPLHLPASADSVAAAGRGVIESFGGLWPMLLIFLLSAPLSEELTFRGVLYPALRRRFGVRWAVFGSAAIFAAMHPLWSWQLFLPVTQFLGGLIFAWAYERTRSLAWPVALHFAGNAAVIGANLMMAQRPELVLRVFGG